MRRHLSYANVMATIAVFIALGGSSYAALTLGKNDVRSRHIKNGQVKASDLARNAVSSSKVKNGSLLAADFKLGELAAGRQGPTGETGTVDTSNFYDKAASDGRFLGVGAKAADADLLDGLNATDFLGAAAKAADSHKLDGLDAASLEPARIVNVSRAPGATEIEAGNVLRAAYEGVSGATFQNPVVVRVGPGTFAMGAAPLKLVPNVFLVGSGSRATWLTFTGGTGVSAERGCDCPDDDFGHAKRLIQAIGVSTDSLSLARPYESLISGNQRRVDIVNVAVRASNFEVGTLVDDLGADSIIRDSHLFTSRQTYGHGSCCVAGRFLQALKVTGGSVTLDRVVINAVDPRDISGEATAGLDGIVVTGGDVTIRDSSISNVGNGVRGGGFGIKRILGSVIDAFRLGVIGDRVSIDRSRISGGTASDSAGSILAAGQVRVGASVISEISTRSLGVKCAFVYSTDYDPLDSSCR